MCVCVCVRARACVRACVCVCACVRRRYAATTGRWGGVDIVVVVFNFLQLEIDLKVNILLFHQRAVDFYHYSTPGLLTPSNAILSWT